MPMTRGTVTIDGTTGEVTGGGFARALFNAMWPTVESKLGVTPSNGVIQAKQGIAEQCNAQAVIIDYIQANAQVPSGISVSTTGSAAAQTGATTSPGTVT